MEIEKDSIKKLQKARKGKGRRAVSPVIATLLLIAIAVAAGIVLYIFVSGLTTSLSSVKGTVTQPLEVTVIQVASSGITYQIMNPNGVSITIPTSLTDIITDDNGVQVASDTPASCTVATLSPGGSANCTTHSEAFLGLTSGETYKLTVITIDAVGNHYSSNPAPFTAK